MTNEEYLKLSAETLAKQDEAQRTRHFTDLVAPLEESIYCGIHSDRIKREIFYKDPNAKERYGNNINDYLTKLSDARNLQKHNPISLTQEETDLYHAALGISSEVAEINLAIFETLLAGAVLDTVNMKEEVGDILWYLAIICRACGFDFEDCMKANIDKLNKKRYKNGFTTDDALNRDLDGEREILQSK